MYPDENLVLIYLIIFLYVPVSYLVSIQFKYRSISSSKIFIISLLTTPIVGAIIGLSSDKIVSDYPNDVKDKIDMRNRMLKEIEILQKEKQLGLLDEYGEKRLLNIIEGYKQLEVNRHIWLLNSR